GRLAYLAGEVGDEHRRRDWSSRASRMPAIIVFGDDVAPDEADGDADSAAVSPLRPNTST
ncbi:hypothetical protein, partial [Halogeometricum sp. CBA1124]|uniref:hypothetical protein n=1 Tax=Halogeometricum sp. CBA1124 TaxID=2668071 RepID=UPI001E4FD342